MAATIIPALMAGISLSAALVLTISTCHRYPGGSFIELILCSLLVSFNLIIGIVHITEMILCLI